VPVDFVARALPSLIDLRVQVRRADRLVLVGDIRVPRIVARSEAAGDRVRLLLDVVPPTDHQFEASPGRLVLRLVATGIDLDASAAPPSDVVAGVRRLEGEAAVAVDFGPRYAAHRTSEAPSGDGTRITIEITTSGGLPATLGAAEAAPGPATLPPELAALFSPPATPIRTVVIDPGHGGEEEGARGPAGTLEKTVALGVARQLKAALESRLGVRVVLTRDGDETVPLDRRAALANNNRADLFLSIHANASVRRSAAGAEVFFLSLDAEGQPEHDMPEPAADMLPAVGGERAVELILWEMAQVRHLEQSAVLARIIESQLRTRVPMSPRAIQQAPFRVLVGANMPAVLVEMGFITNAEEEARLNDPAHQQRLVQALVEAVVAYRAHLEGQSLQGRPPSSVSHPPGEALR
jgi:N-acetylmuramoyl-L-alanine amidase